MRESGSKQISVALSNKAASSDIAAFQLKRSPRPASLYLCNVHLL